MLCSYVLVAVTPDLFPETQIAADIAVEVCREERRAAGQEVDTTSGWNVEEMENHGARYATRFKLMRERVLAMRALWTEEEASFAGEFVHLDRVWMYPKPRQARVPVLLGGETDHTLKRVVEFCDGWFPRAGGGFDPAIAVARLRAAAEASGRDPASLTTSVFRAPPDAAALAGYREAGITRVLLEVPDLDRDGILRRLDELAPLTKP